MTYSMLKTASRRWSIAVAITALLFFTVIARAQTDNSTLSGIVSDPQNARIPGATIELRNTRTRDIRKTVSNSEGVYNFAAVPPATYVLIVSREGFETFRQVNIMLHPADVRSIDVMMKLGKADVEVIVNDIDQVPDNGQRSSLISANAISHLSTEGRDISELVKNQAGFAIVPPIGITNGTYDPGQVSTSGGLSNFVANGSPTGINVVSDGADITDPNTGNSTTQNINQEMVQEVEIETSAFGADQAKGPIVLNAVTKSGGIDYHGAVYLYGRSHYMNSQNWFSKNQGLPDAQDRYLYPGGNVGGPVRIPFAGFNRSKRLTFFAGGEDYIQRGVYAYGNALNASILALVPTANMRKGNFSPAELANYLGVSISDIRNNCNSNSGDTYLITYLHLCGVPYGATNVTGYSVVNTGLNDTTDGVIPQGALDPGAMALMSSMPLPNRPTTGGFNYLTTNFQNNDLWQANGRLDDAYSEKLKFSLFYSVEHGRTAGIPETTSYSPANGGPGMGGVDTPGKSVLNVLTQSLSLNSTYILNPTLTNEAFASAALNRNNISPLNGALLQASYYGYNYSGIYANNGKQIPQFGDYGYDGLPIALYPDYSYGKLFQHTFTPTFGDNVTKSWRSHTIKAGVYLQRTTSNNAAPGPQTSGNITDYYLPNGTNFTNPDGTTGHTLFSGGTTGQNPVTGSSGNYLADFAIGDIASFSQQNFETNLNLYYWNIAFFATDSWKATKRLTVNYGLRVEHLGPWQDSHGNGVAVFSPAVYANPISELLPGFTWHGLDKTVPNSGLASRLFFYSPRAGVAYDLYGDGKTILRGGFGFYRSHDPGGPYAAAVGTAQGMFTSNVGGAGIQLTKLQRATTSLADCVNQNLAGDSSKCPSLNAYVYGVDRNDNQQPLTYTYNFTVTQRTTQRTMFEIAYVGSQTQDLLLDTSLQNVDALPIGALFARDPLTGKVTLPNSLSIAAQGDFRPYHPYTSVYVARHLSYSNYNALQASFARRSGSLRYDLNYTWSKSLGIHTVSGQYPDPFYLRNNYGPLNTDRSQILNFTFSYDVGDRFRENHILKAALNNWEISGITGFQSGPNLQANYSSDFKLKGTITGPVNGVTTSTSINNTTFLGTPDVGLQPYLICDPSIGLHSKEYINGSCFQLPGIGAKNGSFNFPYLHGPSYFNSDLTVVRNFKFAHARALQIRFAGFNFLNHPIPSFSGRFPSEANLIFSGDTAADAKATSITGNCSVVGSTCFGYAGYKQGRRVLEVAAKFSF